MNILERNPYQECDFGDKRLTQRAVSIAECLSVKYGEPLSKVFKSASDLKRGYEFFSNPKTTFSKLTQPSFKETARQINGIPVVLAVGDTSFLDYKKILDKRNSVRFNVYAVHAKEIDTPDGCEPVEWMLLTTESVLSQQDAASVLRWYT